jgi:hypothetical protein
VGTTRMALEGADRSQKSVEIDLQPRSANGMI